MNKIGFDNKKYLEMQSAKILDRIKMVWQNPDETIINYYDTAIKVGEFFEKVNNNIIKVQNIITELRATLDFKYPTAQDFDRVYEYIGSLLVQANIKKDLELINQSLDQIRNASVEELAALPGMNKKAAENVYAFFHKEG